VITPIASTSMMKNRRELCVDLESLDGGTLLEHLVALEPQALEWLTERWRVLGSG